MAEVCAGLSFMAALTPTLKVIEDHKLRIVWCVCQSQTSFTLFMNLLLYLFIKVVGAMHSVYIGKGNLSGVRILQHVSSATAFQNIHSRTTFLSAGSPT